MMDKGTKTEFCKSLDWKIKLQWFDKTGIHKFPDGRIARIELDTYGTSGEYPGFLVTILNPKEGKVDAKYFQFDDYLGRFAKDRKDERAPDGPSPDRYPHDADQYRCFQVVVMGRCGWRWYIAEPKTTEPFCEAVEAYIKAFE